MCNLAVVFYCLTLRDQTGLKPLFNDLTPVKLGWLSFLSYAMISWIMLLLNALNIFFLYKFSTLEYKIFLNSVCMSSIFVRKIFLKATVTILFWEFIINWTFMFLFAGWRQNPGVSMNRPRLWDIFVRLHIPQWRVISGLFLSCKVPSYSQCY